MSTQANDVERGTPRRPMKAAEFARMKMRMRRGAQGAAFLLLILGAIVGSALLPSRGVEPSLPTAVMAVDTTPHPARLRRLAENAAPTDPWFYVYNDTDFPAECEGTVGGAAVPDSCCSLTTATASLTNGNLGFSDIFDTTTIADAEGSCAGPFDVYGGPYTGYPEYFTVGSQFIDHGNGTFSYTERCLADGASAPNCSACSAAPVVDAQPDGCYHANPFPGEKWLIKPPAGVLSSADAGPEDVDEVDSFFGEYPVGLFTEQQIKGGCVVFYILGSLYMFLALSIVCDEFFVPALERMSEVWEVSNEVAGATLMAAGGSAPELFTSFIGTFTGSSVGFGTIVGSAVFNVLFVIGMCAVFSGGVLSLTWWPLARDSSYYALALLCLAIFFGVNNKGIINPATCEEQAEIEWYEALVLFLLYIGYVVVMKFNKPLRIYFSGGKKAPEATAEAKIANPVAGEAQDEAPDTDLVAKGEDEIHHRAFTSTFRAGILQIMAGQSATDWAGVYAVTEIKGEVHETFDKISAYETKDGMIDRDELKKLLTQCKNGKAPSDEDVDKAMKELDTSGDGMIDFEEFQDWYLKSEHMVLDEVERKFDMLDTNNNGMITKDALQKLLEQLDLEDVREAVEKAAAELRFADTEDSPAGCVKKELFLDWFLKSPYVDAKIRANKLHADAIETEHDGPLEIKWPDHGRTSQQIMFLVTLPLVLVMAYTIPDVRNEKWENWYMPAFFGSIVWIGGFSYLMVWWITITGNAFSIPVEVMGLTFLAAGTSIPDLLSSVIVAKQGEGDMAVSSSIGSNIFDVLVGLPLPWLSKAIYNMAVGQPNYVVVEAGTLFVSLLILFLMIIAVITIIKLSNWTLTNSLGYSMFALYVLFVLQDLLRNPCVTTIFVDGCASTDEVVVCDTITEL